MDNISYPNLIALKGTFLSGSPSESKTVSVFPSSNFSKANLVFTKVIGHISLLISILCILLTKNQLDETD